MNWSPKSRSKLYDRLAKIYLNTDKTMHQVCIEHYEKTGDLPNSRTLGVHVRKLKKQMYKAPYMEWAILVDVE